MSSIKKDRIKFYSANDLSTGSYIQEIEKFVLKTQQVISIDDFFEIYNIKLYFENDFYPKGWSEENKEKYTQELQTIYKIAKEKIFIKKINDTHINITFNELDFKYQDNFWRLFNDYKIYKNISRDAFKDFINTQPQQIRNILNYQHVVAYFNNTIKDFLVQYANAAEIIIDSEENKNIFLPKSLTIMNKEEIIKKYLSQNTPQGLTYSRFIKNHKNSDSLKLSDKTRLLAKKRYTQLNKDLFKEKSSIGISLSVYIDKDQEEPIKEKYNEMKHEISIGEKYLKNLAENIDLFELFENTFINNGLITLIANENHEDIFSILLSKSKTEYAPNNYVFNIYESRALLIIKMISEHLSNGGESIEEYIDSFVTYLNRHMQPNKLIFNAPSKNVSHLEKTRHLISEFEAILKQYSLLTDEGEIDYDLIHISTKSTPFGEIKSRKDKKYIYSNSDDLEGKKNVFFSKQTWLLPDSTNRKKSDNLYKLFTKERITLEDFKDYQRPQIEKLIEDEYLILTKLGNIEINNPDIMRVLFRLYNDNVITYNYCNLSVREEIDKLIQKNNLIIENKLFTKDEVSYLNFLMNEKEFTDGYKLHNRYAHGANSFSKEQHEVDYLRILKILILVLLKIEDDILEN